MASVNKVILVGNLGNDPELRTTPSGQSVANFNLATNDRFQKDGEWQDKTEWHRIVVWGKVAENCQRYLSKGRQVYIEGKLQTRQWDKDGEKRYTTEVVAFTVQFLQGEGGGQRSEGGDGGKSKAPDKTPGPPAQTQQAPTKGSDDDDFPF